MKSNLLKKSILIVLIVIGVYGAINNLLVYSERKNTQYSSNISPATPMSDLPLKITKEFGLYKDTDGVYYYGGAIQNNGSKDIIIEELHYTFNRGTKTYMQTIIETDIRISPESTYTLYDAPLFVVYDDTYVIDYAYVKITVNGQEQYLYHENYQSVINKYNEILSKDKDDFEKIINQPLKNCIGFTVFTVIVCAFLIKAFIIENEK